VFVTDYVFHNPKKELWRILFMFLFMSLLSITNVQRYDFLYFANTALQWSMLFILLSLTEYIPVSQQPDQVYQRMLRRFFRSCEFLMATMGWDRQHRPLALASWRRTFHANEVATLPGKLMIWGRFLPSTALGSTTPEQLKALAMSLQALSYGIQNFEETGNFHRSELLARALQADVCRWRIALQEIFGQLSEKPEAAEATSLQSRLDAMYARLEMRIEEAIDEIDQTAASDEKMKNMYRILGAHRGMSKALLEFVKRAARIDWGSLREARF
jgi:hypothetical protein